MIRELNKSGGLFAISDKISKTLSQDLEYMLQSGIFSMAKKQQNKKVPQINKNNKTRPENLMKKEYVESYEELKKDIRKNQKT